MPESALKKYSEILDLPYPGSIEEAVLSRNAWIDTSVMFHRSEKYYHDICTEIGKLLGVDAFTADDGGIHDSVMAAKLVELLSARLGNPVPYEPVTIVDQIDNIIITIVKE